MLPTDMRQPTQAWIDAGTAWVDANPQKIRAFKAAWDGAATREQQEQTLRAMVTETETALSIQGIKLRFGRTSKGQPFQTTGPHDITVDLDHSYFQYRSNVLHFSDMTGAVLHELAHTRQIALAQKMEGQTGMLMNTVWFASRGEAISSSGGKIYLVYPIEMQTHIIHNAIRDRVGKTLQP